MGFLEQLFRGPAPGPEGAEFDNAITGSDARSSMGAALRSFANSQNSLNGINLNSPQSYDSNLQRSLIGALGQQNGFGNQNQVFDQQQALAGQLQGVADGTGPNPAQAQLAQATGQNVAGQAALMASQRGASANPALLARLAAQQGGAIQQQAAGQAATMQAQQSLAALGQLQGQQQAMGQLASQQAQQQIGATQNFGQQQQAQEGLGLQKQQLQQALSGLSLQQQQTQFQQLDNQNKNALNMQANINNANAGLNSSQTEAGGRVLGSLVSGAMGAATGGVGKWEGGEIETPRSPMPSHLQQIAAIFHPEAQRQFAHGGGVQQMLSGGHVPGEAQVKGDSPKNDTVKAILSPGEVVIPKSVMESQDPVGGSAEFVKAVMNKKQKDPKALENEFKLALKDAIGNRGKKK